MRPFSHRSTVAFVLSAGLLPIIAGCGGEMGTIVGGAVSGVTGSGGGSSKEAQLLGAGLKTVDAMSMSDQRAKEIGESVAIAVINQPDMKLSTDDALNAYINKVGLTVASVSSRPDISYTFGVLEATKPNALSMPGGYIFITRGALARMVDESELAGVLAHEVGHVCLGHGKKAMQGTKLLEAGVQAGTADQDMQAIRGAIDDLAKNVAKPFGQGDETSADAEAIRIVKLAGYDPNGLARYLGRVSDGTTSGGMNFSTHPISADRVKRIQAAAAGATGVTLKERFAANVKQ